MFYRWLGALLVILGCGGVGGKIAAVHIKELRMLRRLITLLDYMECELQYRATPLPELCKQTASETSGALEMFFLKFSYALEDRLSSNVSVCVESVLSEIDVLPELTRNALAILGQNLGRFDIEGQLKGFEMARQYCRRIVAELEENKDVRLRGYQTLGLCAGAAIAILFI